MNRYQFKVFSRRKYKGLLYVTTNRGADKAKAAALAQGSTLYPAVTVEML
ncbi:hypothetical protein [Neptuniibacter sp.]|nr:hypothetical protein [Neptuniibacter sp.]MCP4596180.1 hypothetical protein [Neptuniibacter sp.]